MNRTLLIHTWFGLAGLFLVSSVWVQAQETSTDPLPSSGEERVIFDNWNKAVVHNGSQAPTQFTLRQPCLITYLDTYHWNNRQGKMPGVVGLRHQDGTMYGPWQTTGHPGSGANNVLWVVKPNVIVKAGVFTVVDSDPNTWSHNSMSQGRGFSKIKGIFQGDVGESKLATVPTLIGISHQLAHARLETLGLILKHAGEPPPNTLVQTQNPQPGTKVKVGTTVTVTLSLAVTAPNLVGMTHKEANKKVEELGLTLKHGSEPSDQATIVHQNPSSGTQVNKGSAVTVVFEEKAPATRLVPSLLGLSHDKAHQTVEKLGLALVHGAEPGMQEVVKTQVPVAGTKVHPGARIQVVFAPLSTIISEELDKVEAKSGDVQISLYWTNKSDLDLHVVCPSGETIWYSHKKSKCGGELDIDRNDSYERSTVTAVENVFWPKGKAPGGKYQVYVNFYSGHSNKPGCQDPSGFNVRIVVQGKSQVFSGTVGSKITRKFLVHQFELLPALVVPNLAGLTIPEARQKVETLGLTLKHPKGPSAQAKIASQIPAPGTRVNKGSAVSVDFQVLVPDFSNLSHDQADQRAKAVGLVVSHAASPKENEVVIGQNPAAGSPAMPGAKVQVTFGVPTVLVPNVVGKTLGAAETILKGKGLTVTFKPFAGNPFLDTVRTQDIPAGTKVALKSPVTLTYGTARMEFGYAGNVTIKGVRVPELVATLNLVITANKAGPGGLMSGTLEAKRICETNRRLPGAFVKFTNIPLPSPTTWEGPGPIVFGFTDSPFTPCFIHECGDATNPTGQRPVPKGTMTLTMVGKTITVTTVGLYYNNYEFGPPTSRVITVMDNGPSDDQALAGLLINCLAADQWAAPTPRLFASANGQFACKILEPDFNKPARGVFFTLDQEGREKALWKANLVNCPHQVFVHDSGRFLVTVDTYGQLGHAHSLVVYGATGELVRDYKLEDLLSAKEIADQVKTTVSSRWWAEDADFRFVGEASFAIRLPWGKVLNIRLDTGKLK